MPIKMKKLVSKVSSVLVLSIAYANQVAAQFYSTADCIEGVTCSEDTRNVVRGYINYFLGFLGLLAIFFVIYAGILMVTSQGDEEQTKKGKTIIMYAGGGIIIILLAFTIVTFFFRAGQTVGG